MEWDFTSRDLAELYETGKSRKYKGLPPSVAKKFIARISQIEAAESIYDLWKTGSLQFKKLQGENNLYSMRVDLHWRLEIEIDWKDEKQTCGCFKVKDLSNHYGD